MDMHWDYAIILFALGVFVPWRSRARIRLLLDSDSLTPADRLSVYSSTIVFQWACCIVVAWRFVARGGYLSLLGLTHPHPLRAAMAVAVLCTLLVLNQILGVKRVSQLPPSERGIVGRLAERLLPHTILEKYLALILVTTVALCEEFIYRGFIEHIFEYRLSSVLAGAAISATFFALAHLYQGRRGLITVFIMGLIFSSVRIWTGSLLPSMAIHFAVDLSAGIASVRMLKPNTNEIRSCATV